MIEARPNGDPKKKEAAALNTDLQTAKVIMVPEASINLGWIQVRNHAAHKNADFEKQTVDTIGDMIAHVRTFMVRHPA